MLRLKLVKHSKDEAGEEEEGNSGLIHGCVVLKELVEPWWNTKRIVCGDSYFASVSTAKELLRLRIRFIGVVKQATKCFPMSYLSTLTLPTRGEWRGVQHKVGGDSQLYVFVWVDRDRRYFITSASSLIEGQPYERRRMRQIEPLDSQAPPERVEFTIKQPRAAEIYYSTCGKIDQHNRQRHDTLKLEKKWRQTIGRRG